MNRLLRDRHIDTLLLGVSTGIGYCVLLSIGSSTIAAALSPYYSLSNLWHDLNSEITQLVGRGVMLGFFWSVILWISVSSKPYSKAAKWIMIVFLPFIVLELILCGIWIPYMSVPSAAKWFAPQYIPSIVFLVLCTGLSLLLKDETRATVCSRCGRPFDPICSKCGYNLRGNESGICSECGTRI